MDYVGEGVRDDRDRIEAKEPFKSILIFDMKIPYLTFKNEKGESLM